MSQNSLPSWWDSPLQGLGEPTVALAQLAMEQGERGRAGRGRGGVGPRVTASVEWLQVAAAEGFLEPTAHKIPAVGSQPAAGARPHMNYRPSCLPANTNLRRPRTRATLSTSSCLQG